MLVSHEEDTSDAVAVAAAEAAATEDTTLSVPIVPVQSRSTRGNIGREPKRFRDQLNV